MCRMDGTSSPYLLLGLLKVEDDEVIVGEVCVGEHEPDAVCGSGGSIAVEGERGWHVGE
jgi:hypothetical protein